MRGDRLNPLTIEKREVKVERLLDRSMEEKVLELLTQMHNEIKDMKANMATKDDLAGMATKVDIAGMATREDLVGMATKDDLAGMATKDDIRRLEGALFRFENKAESKFDALFDGYK